MKKNENKKKTKNSKKKLSPCSQKKKNIYTKSLLKDFESNNGLLSPKKSQEELILPKKKIPNTSQHRRTKSNSQNYLQYMTNNNNNLNSSESKLSFIFRRKKLGNNINNYNYNNYSLVSRNKGLKKFYDENKKSSNLLSISFSLKDFRNNIINAFSHSNIFDSKNSKNKNKKNKIINLKNDRSVFSFDNIMNIEDTRNTTSITNYNNSNLIYNKNKEKNNSKSPQYIKINIKQKQQLYTSKNKSSQIITYTNNDIIKEKVVSPKNNLHRYIYKNSNIKTKKNNNKNNSNNNNGNNNNNDKNSNNNNGNSKFNNIKCHSNSMLTKKTFRNSQKYFSRLSNNNKKLSIINPISEFENTGNNNYMELDNDDDNKSNNKNLCPSTARNSKKKRTKKEMKNCNKTYKQNHYSLNSKRKTKNKETYKKGTSNPINEFKSVEEIHFIFVQINQKKKAFFEKKNFEENKDKYKINL